MSSSLTSVLRQSLAVPFAAGLILLSGCADNGGVATTSAPAPTGGLATGGAGSIYVLQEPTNGITTILQFPVSSTGSVTPSATITPPSGFTFTAIATDSAGQIYAGGYLNSTLQGEVLVYGAGSSGTPSPARTIMGSIYSSSVSPTTFTIPQSMYVGANGTLYILGFDYFTNNVATIGSTGTGVVAPLTFITGTSTQLYDPYCITADAAGNIYITNATAANTGNILIFASGATGNAGPTRTITSTAIPYGIAVDPGSNIYAVLDTTSGAAGSIAEFAAGTSGAVTPLKTISGSSTSISIAGGLRLDAAGNLYAVNETPSGSSYVFNVLAFSPSATGNVVPNVNFKSAFWNAAGSELAVK